MPFTSKWGDPQVFETDIRGNIAPMSMIALQRAAVESDQKRKDDELQYQKDMARNRRIDFWADRGTSSWQEPDYEGADLEKRMRSSADIQLDTQQRSGDITGHLAETYEPGKYARKNQADLDAARNEDINYWDPRHQSRMADEYGRKYDLATAPATVAAGSRNYVADQAANAKLGAAGMEQSTDAIAALAKLIGAGGFGTNPKTGDKTPPPQEAQNSILSLIQRSMSGQNGSQTFDPSTESEIQKAMQSTGASRQEVIAHFQKIGRIR